MGPSKAAADAEARRLTEEILDLLRTRGMGSGSLDRPNGRSSFDDGLKIKLLAVIEEIVWDDDCAGF